MDRQIDILFVDDQWCRPEEESTIVAAFGRLMRREVPYVFHYETADVGRGRYGVEPVLQKIHAIPGLKAVILDVMFGSDEDRLGLKILEEIRKRYPVLPVLMMTSIEVDGDSSTLKTAMELGASDYLIKKPTIDEFESALKPYTHLSASNSEQAIWGNSKGIRKVRADIARIATLRREADINVLISGESGTGKELVARALLRHSSRRKGNFVAVNCAAIPSTLIEAELFGAEKGAYSGAEQQKIGYFEAADGGVLFLDEISSMSLEMQAKLLRVIEDKTFQRVGGRENIRSDFRLICATNVDLESLEKDGKLRPDFMERINGYPINVPPLRERAEDIPILSDLFVKRLRVVSLMTSPTESFTEDAIAELKTYLWPGNVRELWKVIARAVLNAEGEKIDRVEIRKAIGRKYGQSSGMVHDSMLPAEESEWVRYLIKAQLRILLEAKSRLKAEGRPSQAQFMKALFPYSSTQNAKGLQDLMKRILGKPWGDLRYMEDKELAELVNNFMNWKT